LQIQELVDFLARSHPEDQRLIFIAPFQEVLKIEKDEENGSEPSELTQEVLDKRKKVVSMVITEVKGFGDGSEKGEQCY
jgi:translation initiation factor 3 subunit M